MVAARCSTCQSGKNVPWNWWENCQHEKYVTITEVTVTRPRYEDEVVDGKPTGRKFVTGEEKVVEFVPVPNWKEVAVSPRINQGRGYQRNRRKGAIMPEELLQDPKYRALWPTASGFVCQYRGCFEQEGLLNYEDVGVFHDRREAQLVYFDKEGKTLEYDNQQDPDSQGKRLNMLNAAPIGVGTA
jgi:hypothetical protein